MLVVAAASVLFLSGCAPTPSVDLAAAQEWIDSISASESDGPGAAGTAAAEIGPADTGATVVRLDFPEATVLSRLDLRCYGDAEDDITARISVTMQTAAGDTIPLEQEIPCDRDAHEVELDPSPVASVAVEGTASAQTYMHATVIQQLVVER